MGRFIVQKNMQIQWLRHSVQVVWHGDYHMKQLTQTQLSCEMEEFYFTIQGTGIEVEVLYEEQLIITVEKILACSIDAKDE